MLTDCPIFRNMFRSHRRVAPVDNVGVYTIPLEYSSSSQSELRPQSVEFKGGQFDSDLSLVDNRRKTPCTEEEKQDIEPGDMKSRNRNLLCRLAVDLPIFAAVVTLVVLLEFAYIPFNRSGYYCKDDAISFPFIRDTVSMSALVVSSLAIPFFVLWSCEFALYRHTDYSISSSRWLESLKTCSVWYRDYMVGLVANFLLIEAMKMITGSPRPTFLDICEPDQVNCTKGEYVTKFKCTSTRFSKWFILDASRSFPSGHTSFSVCAALFTIWYLQRRAFSWHNRSLVAVPLLQTLCLVYAVVCSLTRITDHRHHWWDVAVGFFVGVTTALYTVLVLSKNFHCPAAASTSDISSNESGAHHPSVRRLLTSESSNHTLPHAHIANMP